METKKLLLCSKGIKVCVCVSIYEITILKRSKTLVSIHKFRLPRSHEPNTNFYATVYRNVRVCMGFCVYSATVSLSCVCGCGHSLMWTIQTSLSLSHGIGIPIFLLMIPIYIGVDCKRVCTNLSNTFIFSLMPCVFFTYTGIIFWSVYLILAFRVKEKKMK